MVVFPLISYACHSFSFGSNVGYRQKMSSEFVPVVVPAVLEEQIGNGTWLLCIVNSLSFERGKDKAVERAEEGLELSLKFHDSACSDAIYPHFEIITNIGNTCILDVDKTITRILPSPSHQR